MKTRAPPKAGATLDTVRALALALPGMEEGTSYGTPAFKAGGKLVARMHQDGASLVVFVDPDARDLLMRSDPETFYVTDHYVGHPLVLVRLARATRGPLALLLEEAWRMRAPTALVAGGPARKAPKPARAAGKAPPPAATPGKPRGPARLRGPARPRGAPDDALTRLRALCLALPETSEVTKHGRPCFAVRDKTFVMFMDDHHGDGRLAIWCKAPPGAQAELVEASPRRFFVPPYVGPSGWIGARLDVEVDWSAIRACVEESYRMSAPKPGVRARKAPAGSSGASREGSSSRRR